MATPGDPETGFDTLDRRRHAHQSVTPGISAGCTNMPRLLVKYGETSRWYAQYGP